MGPVLDGLLRTRNSRAMPLYLDEHQLTAAVVSYRCEKRP